VKRIGVIGFPLKQSLSPAFQQAALDHLGIDARYEAWETPAERLAEVVKELRVPDCFGANVTIPYKEAVIPLLDNVDELSQQVGAVNTIVNRDGELHGYNTDVSGFLQALKEDAGFDPARRRALVLGAGGAARAVVLALIRQGATAVTIINRTYARSTALVDDLSPYGSTSLHALPHAYASLAAALLGCHLLVNCTSVGMTGMADVKASPLPPDLIPSNALVFDLVYSPPQTKLMAAAKKRGAQVLGGLPMLVYQGAASFEMWTGQAAPLDVMRKSALKALRLATVKGSR